MSRRPSSPALSIASNSDLRLSDLERMLIVNFRAIDGEAQDFIANTAAHFVRSFPAERPCLVLVAGGVKGGAV